ncbi:hypothetical protein BKA70DRAFT_1398542, partial [Coprinopsis sp. MPI-PUGE-AT-0042]
LGYNHDNIHCLQLVKDYEHLGSPLSSFVKLWATSQGQTTWVLSRPLRWLPQLFGSPVKRRYFPAPISIKQRSAKNHTAHHLTGLKILLLNEGLLSYIRIVSVTHSPDGSYTF